MKKVADEVARRAAIEIRGSARKSIEQRVVEMLGIVGIAEPRRRARVPASTVRWHAPARDDCHCARLPPESRPSPLAKKKERSGLQMETWRRCCGATGLGRRMIRMLCAKLNGRQVDVLLANAGRGLGKAFLDQDFADIRCVID